MTVGIRVYHDTDQAIPWETETTLKFNTVRWDTDNIHDPKHNTRLTCMTEGIYIIVAMCIWAKIQPLTMAQLTIKLNGGGIIATDRRNVNYSLVDEKAMKYNPFNSCTTLWYLYEGDYVEAVAFHDNVFISGLDKSDKFNYPVVKRASHLDSPEFMMHLLR